MLSGRITSFQCRLTNELLETHTYTDLRLPRATIEHHGYSKDGDLPSVVVTISVNRDELILR